MRGGLKQYKVRWADNWWLKSTNRRKCIKLRKVSWICMKNCWAEIHWCESTNESLVQKIDEVKYMTESAKVKMDEFQVK